MQSSWNSRATSYVLLLATLIVYIKNFWLNEDAFIVFRSLEQLQAGNGAVWNAGERVQVYTSTAWYWLLAAINALLRDVITTTIVASTALMFFMLLLARRIYRDTPALWFLLIACLLSKGFFDYTSSGLENILAYTVFFALYAAYRQAYLQPAALQPTAAATPANLYTIAALTACVPLIRHDLVLLCALPFALLLWQQRYNLRCVAAMLAIAVLPLLLWTIASLVYYGLPLPNTAYAKLNHGFPGDFILQTGIGFFYWNARLDPITSLIIALGTLLALWNAQAWQRAFACSVVLYCLYLLDSGGDYMLGRFLSFPFLIAALLIADHLRRISLSPRTRGFAAVCALAYVVLIADTPVTTPWTYGRDADATTLLHDSRATGVLNQRALHYPTTLAAWCRGEQRHDGVLETLRRDGENLRRDGNQVAVRGALGTTGYYAGLDVHIVDFFALTDPLLSHLPAIRRQVSGHFEREIVPGYVEHLRDGVTTLSDENLDRFYQYIALLARSDDLFSWRRLQAIIDFNLGRYDSLLTNYRLDIAKRNENTTGT